MRHKIITLAVGLGLGMAATLGAQAPAQAAVPDAWGFAFVNNPAPPPGMVTDTTRQWGSWKTAFPLDWATVSEIGFGRYEVRFPHLASSRGVVHVTSVNGGPTWCQVMRWGASGADLLVHVQCYRTGGVLDRSRFAVTYSTSSGPLPAGTGSYAYVFANLLGGEIHNYNSTGAPNSSAHVGPGQYRVKLPGVAVVGAGLDGNVQVTAVHPNSPRRCKVSGLTRIGPDYLVDVLCHDQLNALTDSWFNLTYHNKRAVFGGLAPPKNIAYLWFGGGGATNYNSQGGVNTITVAGPAMWMVQFPLVGVRETTVGVTAFGNTPDECHLQEVWGVGGGTVIVRNVICFNGAGALAPNRWFVTYSSRV